MREILFRGKDSEGKWHYGHYFRYGVHVYIGDRFDDFHSEVNAKTVGEFTGLIDKTGRKIFEDDIVKSVQDDLFVISWEDGQFMANNINDWLFAFEVAGKRGKIIGNIHDNPELLGGAK